ncbi:hypothetical protein [Acidisoma sp. L85]|uniref:hypothetical protein n=1 Tax=Acidisoma sp. L85 TaxID=1641850 RepID=UPI001C20BE58|nr:hypothetical protein [Acidisoma sp. L85]
MRWDRRLAESAAIGCLTAAIAGTSAYAQQPDSATQSQWFTGPLVAPSPALSAAGDFETEPYAVYTGNTGSYAGNWSHRSVTTDLSEAQSETLLEYGITDRLSIQAVPSFGALWTGRNSSFGAGDLPVELKYRFNDQNVATGAPSMTAFLGMSFPLGGYDRLTTPSIGQGSGAFTIKEGVLLQSLFDTPGNHPLRLRLYADAFEPFAAASVSDISVYGTAQGFHGHVTPGFATDTGLGVEYGLSQRWVLALDLVQDYANTTLVSGAIGAAAVTTLKSPASIAISVAPAVEYNFSGNVGMIAGVQLSVAGRNTASYVAPQIALSASF